MQKNWSGDVVVITYGLSNPSSGIDCSTEFTTPKNVGKIDYLLVGGGGAGGWASTIISQGGGGGGGGGTSFSQTNQSVTPGRTYSIQVGAGAVVGTRNDGHISCTRGNAGESTRSVREYGGTSKLGKFIAEGGGCAEDTGGVERGSDGGISANGRTGGRGGSCAYRPCVSGVVMTLPTTTFYTTAPTVSGMQAWEGAGGGGGAKYSDDPNSACNYGNPNWNFYTGCDGWDIGGRGAFGGIGGDGIQSWYQGQCNFYYGGGGGGGGSTTLTNDRNSYLNTFFGQILIYSWNGTSTVFGGASTHYAKNWMPLGGYGGIGGGGQAATSTTNWSEIAPSSVHYQAGQDGVDGCGGGGGGGQAYKPGVYLFDDIYVDTPTYNSYGDQIFSLNGTQFVASRDSNHNRIQIVDETLSNPSFQYEAINNPSNHIIADDYGYIYEKQNYPNYYLGNGSGNESGSGYDFYDEYGNSYSLATSYTFGTHVFQITSTPDIYDHFVEYIDQNGIIGYLDYFYLDFYIAGYEQTDFMPAATNHVLLKSKEPTAQDLDRPGKGGNGLVAIRFRLDQDYGSQYNPAIKVPSSEKIWPTLNQVVIPIALKQSAGAGYFCIDLLDPSNLTSTYSGSTIRLKLANSVGPSLSESETASTLKNLLSQLVVTKSVQDYLIRDKDAWVANKKIYLKVRYSGSDSIADNSCDNSDRDIPAGGTPLTQIIAIERIPATQIRSLSSIPKNGRQNN
jgi:hypothetical protein